jgi:hypothetical protein
MAYRLPPRTAVAGACGGRAAHPSQGVRLSAAADEPVRIEMADAVPRAPPEE